MYFVELQNVITAGGIMGNRAGGVDGTWYMTEGAARLAIANHHGVNLLTTHTTYVGRGILLETLESQGATWIYTINNAAWQLVA